MPGRYLAAENIRSVAVIGTGAVGASWSALFIAHGIRVVAHDPADGAEARARQFIGKAWPALRRLGIARAAAPDFGSMLSFAASATEAAREAEVIQENVFEDARLKISVLAELDGVAPDKIILSSTGGITPTALQTACRHPERVVVMHPFNPAHLMPLVEIVGSRQTAPQVVDWAMAFARRLGKHPIRVNVEASGHLTNRLQFALIREAVACLVDGVASAEDIDAALRFGLAPRWTLMGSLLTLHLAGGRGGMQGILEHTGHAIEEWWTPRSTPTLSTEVKARLIEAAREVARGRGVDEWVQWRDEQLVVLISRQNESRGTEPGDP
jgi:carnitine 3-dehydrogenase